MSTIEVTDETFQTDVLDAPVPVLVDFWAPWCAPCRMVAPILEELAETYAGQITVAKVNVDDNPIVAQQLRIQSIPTLVLFDGGQPVRAVQGALPREALVELIESNVSALAPPTITVDELAKLMDAGAPVQAIDLRDPRDFSRSHLRKARCVAPDALTEALADISPDTLVVLIDRTGEGAVKVAKDAAGQGPHRVVALDKGLLEWEGSGRPTYSDKEEAALDG